MNPLNGELSPWRLRSRPIPMPESNPAVVKIIRFCESDVALQKWTEFFSSGIPVSLPPDSVHKLEVQANVHSTAFLGWTFGGLEANSQIRLRVTYSEGYELEPPDYPFFRRKADRLDASTGKIIGPHDELVLAVPQGQTVSYSPFWFRTFRVLRIEIAVGSGSLSLQSFKATQVNYPLAIKASWKQPADSYSERIWDVSIRTMRNCMFDGYADCPFYEQLQYVPLPCNFPNK